MTSAELRIASFHDDFYFTNCLVLSLGRGRPCWIIDPGLPPAAEEMLAYIEKDKLTPQAILITHAHGDHMAGIDEIRRDYPNLPVYLAREEWPMLTDPMENLSGHFGRGVRATPDNLLDLTPGLSLDLDGAAWSVIDTSGHSPGGRTLYCPAHQLAIVGDAIFAGSVGRVDFPHSDGSRLLRNLHEHILTLPDDTKLVPGHGPATTVGEERKNNPYLQEGNG